MGEKGYIVRDKRRTQSAAEPPHEEPEEWNIATFQNILSTQSSLEITTERKPKIILTDCPEPYKTPEIPNPVTMAETPHEYSMPRRGPAKRRWAGKIIATLLASVGVIIAADMYTVNKNRVKEQTNAIGAQQGCPAGLEEPKLSYSEAAVYKLKQTLDPRNARQEIEEKMKMELEKKIENLGPADARCAANIRDIAIQYNTPRFAKASVDALGRFNTHEARDALYTLVVRNAPVKNEVRPLAAQELFRLDKNLARRALLEGPCAQGRCNEESRYASVFQKLLESSQSTDELLVTYMNRNDAESVASFIASNPGNYFDYKQRLLDLLVPRITRTYMSGDSFRCDVGIDNLLTYARALRNVDVDYSEKVLASMALDSCRYQWSNSNTRQLLLDALNGR